MLDSHGVITLVGRVLGLTALALAFAVSAAPAERPLHLAGPERQAKDIVGFVLQEVGTSQLARVGETLTPAGPRTNLGFVDAWATPPQGGVVAVAAHPTESGTFHDSIRFVELRGLRLVRGTIPLGGPTTALLWANPHRIVALVRDCCSNAASIVVVDPGARRVRVAGREWIVPRRGGISGSQASA